MNQASQSTEPQKADAARETARVCSSHVRCQRPAKAARRTLDADAAGASAGTARAVTSRTLPAAFDCEASRASALAAALLALLVPLGLMFLLGRGSEPHVELQSAAVLLVLVVLGASVELWRRGRRARAAPRKLGAYTLGPKLGEGGMGLVYRASHALLPRPAAIKLLPPERATLRNRARFEREVRRTSLLTHPNTISVFDFGPTPEGGFYYAMEYVDGLDLQALVEREGPFAPERAAYVLVQVLGALAEAHAAGLVHRDVKPANIMLCARRGLPDAVKLLDFGLVHEVGAGTADELAPDPNELVGTPLYIAPEALLGEGPLDARSDLYAVGAVGYFLLTGSPPFSGRNVLEVCARHLHEIPAPPSQRVAREIPEDLEDLILSCLAKSPASRPASAEVLERALLSFAAPWAAALRVGASPDGTRHRTDGGAFWAFPP